MNRVAIYPGSCVLYNTMGVRRETGHCVRITPRVQR